MSRHAKTIRDSILPQLERGRWVPKEGWSHPTWIKNCEAVASAGFAGKNLVLACLAVGLLAERKPDTVRGIMYALVSVGSLPDTSRKSYTRIQRILNTLRKRRVLPFNWIVDNLRSTEKPSSWSGLADFADTVRDAYRRDFWASLPDYVAVIVEKDTVAGRILPITEKYDVPLHALRGFCSTSFAYAIGDEWRRIEKPITAYYIGDHDPSGIEIERSVRASLTEYSGRDFRWHRLAVRPHHFESYNIIPLAPKHKDTRYRQFTERFGPRCAEVEALPADTLRGMVERAIESHIPVGQWERLQEIEAKEKENWQKIIGKIGGQAA